MGDVPREFGKLLVSGFFELASASQETNCTVRWALSTRSELASDVPTVIDSGSFDVEDGNLVLARHKQFYRRVSDNRAPVAVGGRTLSVDIEGTTTQLMLW